MAKRPGYDHKTMPEPGRFDWTGCMGLNIEKIGL